MSCARCAANEPREHRAGMWGHPHTGDVSEHFMRCGFQEGAPGRAGDWLQTFIGRQFFALDPRPEDFHILDIAAGLRNARYSCQSLVVQTVAEHSRLIWQAAVARGYAPRVRRAALMHDASEAYLVDVPRPIKRDLANYVEIEDRIMCAVAARFDFDWPMPAEVKALDNAILTDERVQNMAPPPAPWRQSEGTKPLGVTVKGWPPERAMMMWLHAAAIEGVF